MQVMEAGWRQRRVLSGQKPRESEREQKDVSDFHAQKSYHWNATGYDRTDPMEIEDFVQRRVAKSNGNLYRPLVNKLARYPWGRWPGRPAPRPRAWLLDIGCAWGRWLPGAARAGYLPVGIDVNFEGLQVARRLMRQQGLECYVVVADLKYLPFRSETFDQVFSYSVIQHANKDYARQCLGECARILRAGGNLLIELPVSHGLTNFRHLLFGRRDTEHPQSWDVRYYSLKEIRALLRNIIGPPRIWPDCYFGIGVRPEDRDIIPWPNKAIVWLSEIFKALARILPPIRWLADSVFAEAIKSK
jgi:2-polyprenyl-3-methyl-5-hydroxy-6-metoxy-1,4-benzoquinol methylase